MTLLRKIDHLGIAVRSLEEALPKWTQGLGFRLLRTEVVEGQKVKVAVLEDESEHIELLEPTSPDSPVAKFLESRGEGIHHTCFLVEDIRATLATLKERGFRLVNETPVQGAGGCLVAFLHPKSTSGSLIEIKEIP
ncbi:MAG: methylmalonyl-CoA epimerase [Planctomycetota bacterium]